MTAGTNSSEAVAAYSFHGMRAKSVESETYRSPATSKKPTMSPDLNTGKTDHFTIDTPESQQTSSATIGTQTDLSLSIGLEVPKWIPVVEHVKRLEGVVKGATSDLDEAI